MTEVLIRKGKFGHRHTHREECLVETDRRWWPCEGRSRVKFCCHKPRSNWATRTGRGKEGLPTKGFRGSMALPTPWFQMFDLQNCESIHFWGFSGTQFVVLCHSSHRNLIPRLNQSSTIRNLHLFPLRPDPSPCPWRTLLEPNDPSQRPYLSLYLLKCLTGAPLKKFKAF